MVELGGCSWNHLLSHQCRAPRTVYTLRGNYCTYLYALLAWIFTRTLFLMWMAYRQSYPWPSSYPVSSQCFCQTRSRSLLSSSTWSFPTCARYKLNHPFGICRLWLTIDRRWIVAFAFAANDYNTGNCHANAPPGIPCSKKWANEAFIFLALCVNNTPTDKNTSGSVLTPSSIFTFFAVLLESISLWSYRRGQGNNRSSETAPLRGNERRAASPVRENGGPTYPSSHPLHHHHDVEKLQGEGQPSRPTHFTEHTSAGATGGASTAPSQPLYAAPAQPGYAAPAQPGYAVPAPAPAQTGYAAPMQPA